MQISETNEFLAHRARLERERARWMSGDSPDHPQGLSGVEGFSDPHQPERYDLRAMIYRGTYLDYLEMAG